MIQRLVIAVFMAMVILSGCQKPPVQETRAPALVKVQTIEKIIPQAQGDTYSSTVEPYSRIVLTFRAQGYVQSIHQVVEKDGSRHYADPGDWISAGTVLATLRTKDFENRVVSAESQYQRSIAAADGAGSQLSQAQAAVETAQAAAAQAQAGVKEAGAAREQARAKIREAQADYEKNRLNYDRAKSLLESESMTRADYDSAKAARDASRARLDEARQQLKMGEARVGEAQASYRMAMARVEEARGAAGSAGANARGQQAAVAGAQSQLDQAHLDYSDAFLKSPINGVILSRNVEIGSQASPSVAAFEVAEMDSVKVSFGVPDFVVNQLRLGQEVEVTCDAVPSRIYRGRIMTLSAGADPKDRTFKVEVRLKNQDGKLRVGMIATTRLFRKSMGRTDAEIAIPLGCLVRNDSDPGSVWVYVVEKRSGGPVARMRKIQAGEAVGNSVIIKSGLEPGDMVITDGVSLVRDGDIVKIGE